MIGCHYDIVVLIETWFDETVDSAELFDPTIWVVYRTDRHDLGDIRNGGGVLIAVRITHASSPVSMPNESSIERIWASVAMSNTRLFVGAAYIPPNAPSEQYAMIIESTRSIMQSIDDADEVFLFGDFNRPIKWFRDDENPCILHPASGTPVDDDFFDEMAELGLNQVCNVHTKNQLDLVFTTVDSDLQVYNASHALKRDSFHHASVELTYVTHEFVLVDEDEDAPHQFDFRRADIQGLSSALLSIDWEAELSFANLNDAVDHLYARLYDLFGRFVPRRTQRRKFQEPWMTAHLARLRNRRNRVHKAWKKYGSHATFIRFVAARDEYP